MAETIPSEKMNLLPNCSERRKKENCCTAMPDCLTSIKDNTVYRELYAKLWSLERFSTMERIKTIATRDLTKSVVTGGCGECQTSCQSACKTSCGVANQKCENSNK